MISAILQQALVFLPIALGVYLTFAILRTADLTVDGSFVLGAGIFAKMIILGFNIPLATAAAVSAGSAAGLGVALMQRHQRISPLIAGILALFVLQSLNLVLMGRPNLSLLNRVAPISTSALIGIALTLAVGMGLLLKSHLGLRLRAFGNNPALVSLMGHPPEPYRIIGLALSNALVAFGGVLTAQSYGYADINMGAGTVLIAITCVLIGQQLERFALKVPSLLIQLAFCCLGVFLYFTLLNVLVSLGVSPLYLKMAVGGGLIAFLFLSRQQVLRGAQL